MYFIRIVSLKAIDSLLFFYTLPLRFVLISYKSVKLFLNFCRFQAEKPHFPSYFGRSEGVKIVFGVSFSGLRACFSTSLLQKLSLSFLFRKCNIL